MAATAGLAVLLETTAAQRQLPRHPAAPARTAAAQVISKATVTNAGAAATSSKNDVNDYDTSTSSSLACAFSCSSAASSRAPLMPVPAATAALSSFLQRCFLCHRELADGRDIYIYRGDRAFCSEECRCRHILVDDDDDCARVVAAAARSSRRRRQAFAGGLAF